MTDYAEEVARRARANGQGWEPPAPIGPQGRIPVFPSHRFTGWLDGYCTAIAEMLQVPIDLPAMLCLATLAGAAGGRCVVEPWEGWREPLNLYVAVAMSPGERKTPVFQRVIKPLEGAEQDAVDIAKPEIAEAKVRWNTAKAKADKADHDAMVASDAAQEEAVKFATQMRLMAEATTMPVMPRLLADDATPESLTSLLYEQQGRLAMFSDEGEVFSMMAGRYSSSGPNLAVYLKGHVGSPIRVDRKGRDPEYIKSPALTLGLTIQPEVLMSVAGIKGARGRGLLGRILWSVPTSKVGNRKTETTPIPVLVEAVYIEEIKMLVRSLAAWTDPAVLVFTPRAATTLREFQADLEPRLGPGGDLHDIADWASKLVGHTARIAGLLHLSENVRTGFGSPVEAEVVADAIHIARYLIAHALIAFEVMGMDARIVDATAILSWVLDRTEFTRRELYKAYQYRFPTVSDLVPALEVLTDHGYIRLRSTDGPNPQGGRPPSPRYIVNPRAQI
jgi:replicative DNA helicase